MQITLSGITHNLKIQTLNSGSINYSCSYTDITATGVSNPLDVQGIITTASTNIIVTSPIVSTTRKIQSLNIFNNGVTNTLKLIKNISATDYILMQVVLRNNETLRIVNDNISILDASGLLKKSNDLELINSGSRSIYKVGTASKGAASSYSFSKDTGFPGIWNVGTPGINGRNTDGTQVADGGCISMGNAASGKWYVRDCNISSTVLGQIELYDVLWVNSGLSVTTLTAQSITQPTLPARDNNGTTSGEDIRIGILVTTATTNTAIIANITVSYTNSDGVPGRTATCSFPATAVIGTVIHFNLASGDKGVRSIQSITIGTSLVAGAISLICYRKLINQSIILANTGSMSFNQYDIPIDNGHCILPFWLATTTTAPIINGNVYFVNK